MVFNTEIQWIRPVLAMLSLCHEIIVAFFWFRGFQVEIQGSEGPCGD